MDAKDFLIIMRNECKRYKVCYVCPFRGRVCKISPFTHLSTDSFEDLVDKTIRVAEKLNHTKTFADDFFKKFPNAQNCNGTPNVCRSRIYGVEVKDCLEIDCITCWRRPYEEQPKEDNT